MKTLCTWVLFLTATFCGAHAQHPSTPAKQQSFACGLSKGCATFNELVKANDPAVRDLRNPNVEYLACFSDEKDLDRFLLLGFTREKRLVWWRDQDEHGVKWESSFDSLEYTDFIDGIANRTDVPPILWKRLADKSGAAPFAQLYDRTLNPNTNVSIDDATITYTAKFTNRDKAEVGYELQIRRSTNRFEERLSTPSITVVHKGRCITFDGGSA